MAEPLTVDEFKQRLADDGATPEQIEAMAKLYVQHLAQRATEQETKYTGFLEKMRQQAPKKLTYQAARDALEQSPQMKEIQKQTGMTIEQILRQHSARKEEQEQELLGSKQTVPPESAKPLPPATTAPLPPPISERPTMDPEDVRKKQEPPPPDQTRKKKKEI